MTASTFSPPVLLDPDLFRRTCLVTPSGWITNGHLGVHCSVAGEDVSVGPAELARSIQGRDAADVFDKDGFPLIPVGLTGKSGVLEDELFTATFAPKMTTAQPVRVSSMALVDQRAFSRRVDIAQCIVDEKRRVVAMCNPQYLTQLGLFPGSPVWHLGRDEPIVDAASADAVRRVVMPLRIDDADPRLGAVLPKWGAP